MIAEWTTITTFTIKAGVRLPVITSVCTIPIPDLFIYSFRSDLRVMAVGPIGR